MDDLIVFLLDKSSSMAILTNDTITGFNSFLREQKVLPGDAKFTLVLFATEHESVYNVRDLQSVPELNTELYVADGFSTAYFDAICNVIDETGKHLAKMPKNERPKKVIFVVLTDGLENDSKVYSRQDVLERITHQREKYSWEFIFLGANMDAVKEGTSMGIASASSVTFTANSEGVKGAYFRTSNLVSARRSTSVPLTETDESL